MNFLRHLARTAMSGYFIVGGLEALRDPSPQADAVEPLTEALASASSSVPALDAPTVVRANGAAQVAGGGLLALNIAPRTTSAALAATLVPPTAAAHRFWEAEPSERRAELIALLKNVALWGGLVVAALDTQGEPGVAWRTQHALEHAELEAEHRREVAGLQADLVRERARATAAGAAAEAARRRAEVKADMRGLAADAKTKAARLQATAEQARRDAGIGYKAAKAAGKGAAAVGRAVTGAATATGRGAVRAAKALTPA